MRCRAQLFWLESANEDQLDQPRAITYRIAVDHQLGRKVFTWQILPAECDAYDAPPTAVGNVAWFSMTQNVSVYPNVADKC